MTLLEAVRNTLRRLHSLRDHVIRNQDAALETGSDPQTTSGEPMGVEALIQPDSISGSDFGQMVQPIALKNYQDLAR